MKNTDELILNADEIKSLLKFGEFKKIRLLFKEKEDADVAEIFTQFEIPEILALFRVIPRHRRPSVFPFIDFEIQKELIEGLPDLMTSALLNEMEPDDRTKLLEDLPVEIRDVILLKLSPEERKVASQLLSYPEGSVGRLMTPDFLALNERMDVSLALKAIHWSRTLPEEFLQYLFVVGDDGHLIGEATLASLVVCDPPSTLIRDVMKKSYIFLSPLDEAQHAVNLFRKYDRNYIPVVDDQEKIIGIVTTDDVFEVAEEEATEDIQQFGGLGVLEDSYFQTPMAVMFRKRAGALAVLFIGGFLTSEALQMYHEALTQWGFLTFFIPLILASGGNSGTQAASLIIRGLAINEISLKDSGRVLYNELLVGLMLGTTLALLWCLRAYLMHLNLQVTMIIGMSIIGVVIVGVMAGSMLPFIFQRMKLDPAVVSSPFISTLVDVTGILILLNIAILVFKYLGVV